MEEIWNPARCRLPMTGTVGIPVQANSQLPSQECNLCIHDRRSENYGPSRQVDSANHSFQLTPFARLTFQFSLVRLMIRFQFFRRSKATVPQVLRSISPRNIMAKAAIVWRTLSCPNHDRRWKSNCSILLFSITSIRIVSGCLLGPVSFGHWEIPGSRRRDSRYFPMLGKTGT